VLLRYVSARHRGYLAGKSQLASSETVVAMIHFWKTSVFCITIWLGVAVCSYAAEPASILTNHLGYEPTLAKRAVIRGGASDHFSDFAIKSSPEGKIVFQGRAVMVGSVDHWRDWRFWTLEFDALQTEGLYFIECRAGEQELRSLPFRVQKNLLERQTLSNVVFYFKGQRCSGALDKADRTMTFLNSSRPAVDVHGGWYDASGDYGKHLSHLAYSTYHNPQQIPLVIYNLLKTRELLEKRGDDNFTQDLRRFLDEALYGADYLVRVKVPGRSFYETVSNRGPAKKPEDRRITPVNRADPNVKPTDPSAAPTEENFEVSYRGGGGVAVAALALKAASRSVGNVR